MMTARWSPWPTPLRGDCPVGCGGRWYVPANCRGEESDAMATATQTLKNFIDGAFVDPADGNTSAVLNPATGEEIAQAPDSGQEAIERGVAAARAAFPAWSPATPADRSLALLKLA